MVASPSTEVSVSLLKGSLVYLMLLCTSSVLFLCLNVQFCPCSSGMPVKNKSSWSVVELGNAQNGSACRVLSPLPLGHCTCSRVQENWLACVATSCFLYRVKLMPCYLVQLCPAVVPWHSGYWCSFKVIILMGVFTQTGLRDLWSRPKCRC